MAESLYQKRAKDVMSTAVVSVHASDPLEDALVLMDENKLSALPVVDRQGRCIGILSATDLVELTREVSDGLSDLSQVSDLSRHWLLKKLGEQDLGQQKIEKVMTSDVAMVDPDEPLVKVAAEMLRHRVHHLPVVDGQARLLGIVSTADILTAVVDGSEA